METKANETIGDDAAELVRVALRASAVDERGVPKRILIAPWGEVQSSSGSFIVDEEAASLTIAAFERHGTDLPVDYEHQTLGGAYSSPSGQAPAAGWIKALSLVAPAEASGDAAESEPGLWAEVEWTSEALKKLGGRQYRYLSPVALVRRSDRRLVGLHSVALTNKPAIVGMQAVVNGESTAAADAAAVSAAGADAADEATPSEELRGMLEIDASAPDEVVLVAAADRIRTLQEDQKLEEASGRVARAMSSGKLTAAQGDWALSLALGDARAFDQWEASAPVVVSLGRLSTPSDGQVQATAHGRAVETAARAEWRANRAFLETLCSEGAYVANALRECAV